METVVRPQGRVEGGARLYVEPRANARYDRPALDRIAPRTTVVPEHHSVEQVIGIPLPVIEAATKVAIPAPDVSERTVRKNYTPQKSKKTRYLVATSLMTLLVIGGGMFAILRPTTSTSQVLAAHTEVPQTATVEEPVTATDDTPPADYLTAFAVSGPLAKIISLPTLGIKAPIVTVGVDGLGHPQQPRHTYQAGWYNVSVHPGENGAVVLSGACHGEYGVFRTLTKLKPDDEISLERGDGAVLHYSVVRTEEITTDKFDTAKLLRPVDTEVKGLNIVTCGGWYDASSNDYSERFIVYTKQI